MVQFKQVYYFDRLIKNIRMLLIVDIRGMKSSSGICDIQRVTKIGRVRRFCEI
jgi:hypothetical protein